MGSAALYFYFAVMWGIAAIKDETVADPGSISLHGWLGAIMSTVAAVGGCVALLAAREGVRRWANDRTLAGGVLTTGAVIGILPALLLLTVPMDA